MPTANIGLADFRSMWRSDGDAYLEALGRVGESGWLVLGKEVATFEEDLARFWGMPHAVGVASGLDALEISLRFAGVEPGDHVLTTPLSAFATTLAIVRIGAIPIFADVDGSGLLDLGHAEHVLREVKRKVRFVVPVHLYGHAHDLDELESFARKHQLVVVEDCAQAIGARSGGRHVGALSAACATSFYPTKNLGALGDGGAVMCPDVASRDYARQMRDYGQSDKYVHDRVGMNSRLDELQAAMLRTVALPRLAERTARRTKIALRYLAEIQNPALEFPTVPRASQSVWHLFPVLVKARDEFQHALQAKGVGTGRHYPILIPSQRALAGLPTLSPKPLERASRFAEQEVSLPLHPFLAEEAVDQIIAACNAWRPR